MPLTPGHSQETISEVNAAWTAGILDGEGCIRVDIQRKKYHRLSVSVAQCDIRMPEKLKKLWGGFISSDHTPKGRPLWNWQRYGEEAGRMLRLVLPYLTVKREQAELAIKFADTIKPKKEQWHSHTPELFEYREGLSLEMARLKHAVA